MLRPPASVSSGVHGLLRGVVAALEDVQHGSLVDLLEAEIEIPFRVEVPAFVTSGDIGTRTGVSSLMQSLDEATRRLWRLEMSVNARALRLLVTRNANLFVT